MAEVKTQPTDGDVDRFLAGVADEQRRADCQILVRLMREATGQPPVMWGTSLVGFGSYHYRYASGREGDWFILGFSPRKHSLTLYLMGGLNEYESLLASLGKHSTGVSCLYVKRLADIDVDVLRQLLAASVAHAPQAA